MEYKPILTIAESEKATVELASMKGHSGPVVVKRLKEANPEIYRLLCHVQNSHLPRIYEVEELGNDVLVAEEHVDGGNLEEYLEKQELSDDAKLGLALQLCDAVEFLHSMEPPIIHRDIKPSNILITGKGVLKLIDFDASRNYKENGSSGDTRLLGTVEYAPPEQFGYSQTDIRSDIYSMGVVFHEMLLAEDEKRAEAWIKLVETCTSFDPKYRFQNVAELKREIEKLIAWKKVQRKKLMTRLMLFVLAAVIVGASIYAAKVAVEKKSELEASLNDSSKVQEMEQSPEILNSGLVENTGDFYYEYPQDVTAVLNNYAFEKINALYLRNTDYAGKAELDRLQAWCYEIATDGKSIRIRKEYLIEIRRDIGQLDLVVACDNGSLHELTIHILAGLPEGVTADTAVEELTPVEIPESRAELYPNLDKAPQQIWYGYYQSAKTEFIIPDDKYREFEVFDYATCYCYQTGLARDIPADMLQLEDGYIVVAQQFMMALEPYVYEFSFYYNNDYDNENMVVSQVFEKTVKVYPEETEVLPTGSLLLKNEQTIYTGYPYIVTNIVRNGKRSRITKFYVLNQNGEKEYPDGDKNLSGRTVWVPGSEFVQYFGQGPVTLYIEFDTGETCEMKINLVEGLPEVLRYQNEVQQEPSEERQEEFSEEILLAMRQAGRYYKSMPVKPAVIFSHRMEQPNLEKVLCYNYMTGETWEVPADMTDAGAGYLSVSGEYVHTLEPALYRFTFVESVFETEINVLIDSESEAPKSVSVENYFMYEPNYYDIGVQAALNFVAPCRIVGVSVLSGAEEISVDSEAYNIACDGRYMLIKREFFQQYQKEESITLIYHFDDGNRYTTDISLKIR